jgi:hypothetical protein
MNAQSGNLFGNLTNDGLEEAQDRLGGFSRLETNSYDGLIKVAYAGQSQGGARNVTLVVDIDGKEYTETVYITNKKGENFFLNKDDNTKKVPLPGFTTINDICLVTTGQPLSEQPTEDKVVKIYDYEQSKEVPKSVPVLIDLLGKQVTLGIIKTIENVNEKVGNDYVPTAKTKEVNSIDKVFEFQTKATVVEATRAAESSGPLKADFHAAWVAKNAGNTRDKTVAVGGQAGRPGATAAGAPPQGNSGAPKKSLFG